MADPVDANEGAPTSLAISERSPALNASALPEGTLEVGSIVSVRYRTDGHALVASAVTERAQ